MNEWDSVTITMAVMIGLLFIAHYWPWHDDGVSYNASQRALDRGGIPEPERGWTRLEGEIVDAEFTIEKL